MAEYNVVAVSNYFKVKDEASFLAWATKCGLTVDEDECDGAKCFRISVGAEADGWPVMGYDEESEQEFDVDVYGDVAEHLKDDCVAIIFETGGMNSFGPHGYVEAVNSKGEAVRMTLNAIYDLAQKLGKEVL